MKKLFTIVCLLMSVMARGQCSWEFIDFDADTCYRPLLVIDTVNYHHNLWQIGKPQKTAFDSAFYSSYPNAIVTDTLNPYLASDTSVFILKLPTKLSYPCYGYYPPLFHFSFFYKLDIDSNLTAKLEISEDSGMHWVDVKDSLPGGFYWDGPALNLTASNPDWKDARLGIDMPMSSVIVDTVLFRFTLISDSDAASKDGWMIDHFAAWYWCEGGVGKMQNPNLMTLYPNPCHSNIYIHTDKPHKDATITIQNIAGQQVYSGVAPVNGYLNLQLPDGVYTLRYSDDDEYCVKRVVIQN